MKYEGMADGIPGSEEEEAAEEGAGFAGNGVDCCATGGIQGTEKIPGSGVKSLWEELQALSMRVMTMEAISDGYKL